MYKANKCTMVTADVLNIKNYKTNVISTMLKMSFEVNYWFQDKIVNLALGHMSLDSRV